MGKSYTARFQVGRVYKMNHVFYQVTKEVGSPMSSKVTLKPVGIDLAFKTFPKNSTKTLIRKQSWR